MFRRSWPGLRPASCRAVLRCPARADVLAAASGRALPAGGERFLSPFEGSFHPYGLNVRQGCGRGRSGGAYGRRMTSSGPETSTRTTGAHRAHREVRDRGAARTLAQRPATRYEPHLDGLFTYCLSVLCDHDAATAALAEVLALAERRGRNVPDELGEPPGLAVRARPLGLSAQAGRGQAETAGRPRRAAAPAGSRRPGPPPARPSPRRSRSSAAANSPRWPGRRPPAPPRSSARRSNSPYATSLAAHEVAAVLGMDPAAARELLATAACEVERTRAALAVVETGACPGVARLTGDSSAAQHRPAPRTRPACRRLPALPPHRRAGRPRPLARHQRHARTRCPCCRRRAPPCTPPCAHHPRARGGRAPLRPARLPVDPKDRVARRDRLRARAVTTTVVATVVAAPVFALWAAYRGAPPSARARTAVRPPRGRTAARSTSTAKKRAPATRTPATPPPAPASASTRTVEADVSVEVVGVAGAEREGAAALGVTAGHSGDTTLITLTATGAVRSAGRPRRARPGCI